MSNRGGRNTGGNRGRGQASGRNPTNRNQNQKPQNSPKPQQPKPTENEQPTTTPAEQSAASPNVEPQVVESPQPESSSPPKTSAPGGSQNPPQKNQQQQKKAPQPAKGGNTKPPAKTNTPQQKPKSPNPIAEPVTPEAPAESPKPQPEKKPAQPTAGKKEPNKPAAKNTPQQQNTKKAEPGKPQTGQQQGGKKPVQAEKKGPQPAAAKNAPPAKKEVPAKNTKPDAKVPSPEDSEDENISNATGGIFQFGQPVHGFTPMSFNFSLPAATEAVPVEPELPSHNGPCVVTTGGVTFTMEQKPNVTLEENEEVAFVSRAKLYRFDPETGEWKERGVGDYKMLKHKETGKYRVLMRRDKIHKVCANHNVPPVPLKPHPTFPETCWVYQTDCDFSDEVAKKSTFAVRFQNVEAAQEFYNIYEQARSSLGVEIPVTTPTKQDVHTNIIQIQSDIGLESKPAPPELTLDFLYKEILEIKSIIQNMQQDIQQLKSSTKNK